MTPAVLVNLMSGSSVEALPGSQLLYELMTQFDVAIVPVAPFVELAQPLPRAAYHQLAEVHGLSPASQRIEGFVHGWRLGD
jgi:hypothetical protein